MQYITDVSELDNLSEAEKKKFVFQVVTPVRIYFFYTESSDERENWVGLIQTKSALSRLISLRKGGR